MVIRRRGNKRAGVRRKVSGPFTATATATANNSGNRGAGTNTNNDRKHPILDSMGFAKYSVPAPCYNKHKSDMKLACHYEIDQIFLTILFKKQY